jgi:hypothetical protein
MQYSRISLHLVRYFWPQKYYMEYLIFSDGDNVGNTFRQSQAQNPCLLWMVNPDLSEPRPLGDHSALAKFCLTLSNYMTMTFENKDRLQHKNMLQLARIITHPWTHSLRPSITLRYTRLSEKIDERTWVPKLHVVLHAHYLTWHIFFARELVWTDPGTVLWGSVANSILNRRHRTRSIVKARGQGRTLVGIALIQSGIAAAANTIPKLYIEGLCLKSQPTVYRIRNSILHRKSMKARFKSQGRALYWKILQIRSHISIEDQNHLSSTHTCLIEYTAKYTKSLQSWAICHSRTRRSHLMEMKSTPCQYCLTFRETGATRKWSFSVDYSISSDSTQNRTPVTYEITLEATADDYCYYMIITWSWRKRYTGW